MFEKIWDQHVVHSEAGKQGRFCTLTSTWSTKSPAPRLSRGYGWLPQSPPTRADIATPDQQCSDQQPVASIADPISRQQVDTLRNNCREFGIRLYDLNDVNQGIVHIIGPELGYTQPGMTIVCGTAIPLHLRRFGALAFGIGTSEVELVFGNANLAAVHSRRLTSYESTAIWRQE